MNLKILKRQASVMLLIILIIFSLFTAISCSTPSLGNELFNLNADEIKKIEFGGNAFLSHVEKVWSERTGKTFASSFMNVSATYTKEDAEFHEIIELINSFRYTHRETYIEQISGYNCYVLIGENTRFNLGVPKSDPLIGNINSISMMEEGGLCAYIGADDTWGERLFEYGVKQMLE